MRLVSKATSFIISSHMRMYLNLYGRVMVLTRSNRDIDQKDAAGNYESTLTPRALFSPDVSMLQCTDKSNLAHNLEKLNSDEQTETPAADEHVSTSSGNAKIAGMVLVQKMTVSASVNMIVVFNMQACDAATVW